MYQSLCIYFKSQGTPLVLQKGGTALIVLNAKRFTLKAIVSIATDHLAALGGPMLIGAACPLITLASIYAHLHIDCNSYVETLPSLPSLESPIEKVQYVEIPDKNDAPVRYNFSCY